jgi:hypothetical protein
MSADIKLVKTRRDLSALFQGALSKGQLATVVRLMQVAAGGAQAASQGEKKSTSDGWCSPPEIAGPLADHFAGPVDVDPCSNERSIIQARMSLRSGGLVLPWRLEKPVDRTGYQNDPYSKSEAWTHKMVAELAAGNVREHVRLCMMSTSTAWWSDMCLLPKRNPRVLALKRIAFLDPDAATAGEKRMGCRFEPALVYFGPRAARFTRTFAHLTRWATWGRS